MCVALVTISGEFKTGQTENVLEILNKSYKSNTKNFNPWQQEYKKLC